MSEVLLFNPPRKYRRHNPIDAVGLAMAGIYPPVAKTRAKSRREVKQAKRLDDQIAKLLSKPSNTAKQKAKAQEQLARYYQQLANLAAFQAGRAGKSSMARMSKKAKKLAGATIGTFAPVAQTAAQQAIAFAPTSSLFSKISPAQQQAIQQAAAKQKAWSAFYSDLLKVGYPSDYNSQTAAKQLFEETQAQETKLLLEDQKAKELARQEREAEERDRRSFLEEAEKKLAAFEADRNRKKRFRPANILARSQDTQAAYLASIDPDYLRGEFADLMTEGTFNSQPVDIQNTYRNALSQSEIEKYYQMFLSEIQAGKDWIDAKEAVKLAILSTHPNLKLNPPLKIYHGDNTMLCDNPRTSKKKKGKKAGKKKLKGKKLKESLAKLEARKKENKKSGTKKASKKVAKKASKKSGKKSAAKKSSKKSFALDFSGKYNKKAFSGSGTLKQNPPTLKNQPVAFTSNVVAGAVVAQVGAPVLLRALGVSQKLGSQIAQGVLQNSQSARQVVSSFIGKRHALEAVSKVGLVLGVAGANKVVKNIAAGGNWYGTSGSIYRASDRYISGRAMFLGSLLSVAHSFFAFMRDKNMLDSLPDTPEQSGAARFLVMQVNDKSNAHIFTPQVQQQLAGAFQALITAGIQARKQGQAAISDWMSMSDWVTVDNAMKQEADKDNQTNVQKERKKQEMIRRKRSMRNYGMSDYVTMSDEDQEDYVGDYVTMSDEVISDEVISDEVISDEVISDEVISDEIYSDNNGTDSISDEDMEDEVISGHQESALFNAKWN